MRNKHIIIYPIIVTRKIQIKEMPLLEWPKIQNTDNTKCWQGCETAVTHRSWKRKITAILEDNSEVS